MSQVSEYVRHATALVVSCQNKEAPDEVCEAIGRAVTLGKPIICIVRPGSKVPEKFALVVDRYVEFVDDPEVLGLAIRDAMVDLGLLTGVQCGCDECKKKADSDCSGKDGGDRQN